MHITILVKQFYSYLRSQLSVYRTNRPLVVVQVLQALHDKFYHSVCSESFLKNCHSVVIKEEIIHILESLCGVAEGSRVDNVEKLFGFLHPLMVESVKLLGKVMEHLVFNYQVYRSIFPFSFEILVMVKLHLQIQNLIKTTTTINTPIFSSPVRKYRKSYCNHPGVGVGVSVSVGVSVGVAQNVKVFG